MRISYGTRTDEGSLAYSSLLSVIETCRDRSINPWTYICEVIAKARKGMHASTTSHWLTSELSKFYLIIRELKISRSGHKDHNLSKVRELTTRTPLDYLNKNALRMGGE